MSCQVPWASCYAHQVLVTTSQANDCAGTMPGQGIIHLCGREYILLMYYYQLLHRDFFELDIRYFYTYFHRVYYHQKYNYLLHVHF